MMNTAASDVGALMRFEASKKSVGAAYLLWVFFAGFGGHRFYCGRAGSGLLMLVLLVVSISAGGLPLILLAAWALIDAFLIPGWIRQANTDLAKKLTPRAATYDASNGPPPIPDARADARIKQAEKRNAAVTQSGRRNALYFGFAALVFWIVVTSAAAVKRSSQEKPAPQTTAGEMSPEFAAKVAEYSAPPAAPAPPNANASSTVETAQQNSWGAVVQSSSPSPQPIALANEKPSAKQTEPTSDIPVPSDTKARYYAENISSTKSGRTRIVSKRIGPSGTSYTQRECDCGQSTYRTIGDGESLEAMRAATPEQKMVKLVHDGSGFGSVSFHVCDHACKAKGSGVDRKKAQKSGPISASDVERLLKTAPTKKRGQPAADPLTTLP